MIALNQTLVIIIVIAFVTFMTRAIPFIIFPDKDKIPEYVVYLGKVLPYSVIGMLIIYCLKNISVIKQPFGIPEFTAIIFIVLVHLWKRNTLFSISGGTVVYMVMVQFVFR